MPCLPHGRRTRVIFQEGIVMQHQYRMTVRAACAAAFAVLPVTSWACATCGCSLSSDAAMGYSSSPGWRVSVEYDFIDQNQLRTGSSAVPAWQLASINDAGGSQEVERQTINRYFNF